jgi:hypothetical protein
MIGKVIRGSDPRGCSTTCTGRERRRPHFLSCLTQIGVSHFDYNHARDWNTTAWARIQLPRQLMVQAAAALGPAGVCAFSVIDLA